MKGLFGDLDFFDEKIEKSRGDRNRADAAERSRENSAAIREIGPLPEVFDRERRRRGLESLGFFLPTYFPDIFNIPFSENHLTAIAKIEETATDGGLYAYAMPRGTGKSAMTKGSAIWVILKGLRRFVQLIGATQGMAKKLLREIKIQFETNDLLLEDFPEVCYPIRQLEGINARAAGQTLNGTRTRIIWTADELSFPFVEGSAASGSAMRAAGILGAIRGASHTTPDGETIRPDYFLADDPQTLRSAASASQNDQRLEVLNKDIIGLAGPKKKIAGLIPCTVIYPGDMADRLLDRKENPRYRGDRTQMIEKWPENMELWEQYGKIRDDGMRADDGGQAARNFYLSHQDDLERGCEVSWPDRYNDDEICAIQNAMNLYFDNLESFESEYQNAPRKAGAGNIFLAADEIAARVNGLPRLVSPTVAKRLTIFIDVQGKLLYYSIVAWSDEFTGAVIDYGAFPDQRREYFTLRNASRTLARHFKTSHLETLIHKGLTELTDWLLGRPYYRQDGSEIPVGIVLVDANWETDAVKGWLATCGLGRIIMPSHGRYVGAAQKPFSDYKDEQGEIVGQDWRIPPAKSRGAVRHVLFDSNAYKTFLQKRWASPLMAPGSLTLWGNDARTHRIVGDHCTAEKAIETRGRDRDCTEWKLPPSKPDNHFLDTLSGCCVGNAVLGGTLSQSRQMRPARGRRKRSRKVSALKI